MKVAIIGAGLQCRRRAPVINEFPETELAVIASDHIGPAQKLAAQFGCEASADWRANPAQAAGGQFIEQGTHAIDLFRWFLGEITEAVCMSGILYFKKQSMDDSGMALFRMESGATASLHTTLTEWQNQFSFEVFGEDGYLKIEGLGSSYGNERLIAGRRDFDAPFQDTVTHFRGGDISWREEWREFLAAIREKREPIGNGQDGLIAMRIALTAYEAELQKRVLPIKGSF